MKPLAIIPARAGSKRLPGKNRERVGGMSLAELAVAAAQNSGLFTGRIALTTDDPWLLSGPDWRMDQPVWLRRRPDDLAQDGTDMIDVVKDVVEEAREVNWCRFDAVVLLQPTSPLRTVADIQAAMRAMEATKADALVSVVEERNPEIYTIGHASRLRPVTRHMDGRRLVVPNGAIYAIRTDVLDAGLDWWTAQSVYGYEMPPERSVDIDTAEDLERARKLWTAQN